MASSPFQDTIDDGVLRAATTEPGEPMPSCVEGTGTSGSAWYLYWPTTDSTVSITTFNSFGLLSVYEGTTLTSLTEQLCLLGPGGGQLVRRTGRVHLLPSRSGVRPVAIRT